jgi:NitT/TauT family transport system ATP-binding protein
MTLPDAAVPAFSFRGLGKRYDSQDGGSTVALQDVSFDVAPGEFVTVVGPSGCGKSTLLRILAGIVTPTEGEVQVTGRPSRGPQRSVGVVFQSPVLFPWRTVLENVLVPAEVQKRPRAEAVERARSYLELVGLSGFETKYPKELSGGMQQRVGIVRALINDPALLLMDEPFGALDAMTRESMNLELLRIRQRLKSTIMLVTHSIPEAVFLGDRVVVMSPRPGRVTQIREVRFDGPRELPLINTPAFGVHVAEIRAGLHATGGID